MQNSIIIAVITFILVGVIWWLTSKPKLSYMRTTIMKNHPKYGPIVTFDKSDYISSQVLPGYVWEEHICQSLANLYQPGSDMLDIGANLGLNSLMLHKMKPVTGTIHLFEPQPDVFMMLKYNSRTLPRKLYNLCLSDQYSTLSFKQDVKNVGGTQMTTGGTGEIMVACIPLDALFFPNNISLIKMDVEGAESAVLQGAVKTLKQHRPAILIEIWKKNLETVTELLNSLGYTLDKHLNGDDYIFLPK